MSCVTALAPLATPTPMVAQRTVLNRPGWTFDPTRSYVQSYTDPRCGVGKPIGFWYGFGTSWVDWCYANRYGDPSRGVLHQLHVARPERVLQLVSEADMRAFLREYRDPTLRTFSNIRWGVLATQVAGIEFPAYQHAHVFEQHDTWGWTYGWDCASGCIWDLQDAGVSVVGTQAVLPNPYPREED
jgi:hypothetical protein